MVKANEEMDEQLTKMRNEQVSAKVIESEKEEIRQRVRILEDKESKREVYITGLEKEIRGLKEDNERLRSNNHQNDRDAYLKMQELERDLILLSD
jgi:hypothetical protein